MTKLAVPLALLLAIPPQSSAQTLFVIDHVTVIDGTGAAPLQEATVLVQDDQIIRVGPAGSVPVPPGAEVIDGTDHFLLPGLWDMHVHISRSLGGPQVLPAFLAFGVTGVRDVGSSDSIAVWAEQTQSGSRLGPRILKAGPQIGVWADLGGAQQPHMDVVSSLEDIAGFMERRRGWADYIKLQDGFSERDVWLAVAEAARSGGHFVAGHIPMNVRLPEAVDAGLRSIEHAFGLSLALSSFEPELRSRVLSGDGGLWDDFIAADADALGTLDEERLAELVRHMKAAEAVLDPTLNEAFAFATASTGGWFEEPQLAYLPRVVRDRWRQTAEDMDPTEFANYRRLWQQVPALVGRMHSMGVTVVAGSGAGTYFMFPGSGLHNELAFLVQAGLTPMEAIQSATIRPMELMGLSSSLGTIEPGKKADMILLDANPLSDISNSRRVVGVWKGGTYFDREALDAMLVAVADEQGKR